MRAAAFRKYAADRGWPADLRPREVQILETLWHLGPQTLPELARRIGCRPNKRGKLLHGNGPGGTYTATLLRRGLILAIPVSRTGNLRRPRFLYSIAPAVEKGVA